MGQAAGELQAAGVKFQTSLNEDLAATALWGTQQAELRGEGRYDGVFGLWYGKGPGVDRSGDVMRHANMAGSSRFGGVLMAMGDDHTGESSTTLHQSDWAMVDAYIPVLSPAGVQEIIDLGLYGYALSRFAGVWAGLKTMKDTVEATAVIDGRPDRMGFVTPDFEMPEGDLNIRLIDTPVEQETRMINHKRFAAEAFARANKIDRRVWGKPGAKIGFVAAGKNWLDLVHALGLLGIDADESERLGLTTYKVAQTWPLDMESFHEWAEGLDLIIVVEEKRKLIEVQVKEAIFDDRRGRRVYGWHKGDSWENGRQVELFPTRFALDPDQVAMRIGEVLVDEGRGTDRVRAALIDLGEAQRAENAPDPATRIPYFCSGCPHNSSTRLPEGARAYAGIGCHYMVQWMDRDTVGFTQMGGEGANWIGEAQFSKRDHVFQNIGDGTYNHSGILAIRAAVAAGTTMTYKILFNDAVAMTGGQANDGDLNPERIAAELTAMGVGKVVVVYDEKEDVNIGALPAGVNAVTREHLNEVQEDLSQIKSVTAIVYVQTCAAEKRRRRKRGLFPDPDQRVFINPDVCEGCGDCGVQSNCVSIVPLETTLGRKRAIDQSSCNKDFSCLHGFCPAFVTIEGAELRKSNGIDIDLGHLPEPEIGPIKGTHNVILTGVGGTGVVTIGAGLAMAAHIDGKAAGMMEMAGLAQKGGAVHIHLRLAEAPDDITAVRVATGEGDLLIGGDLVVSAGSKTLGLMRNSGATAVVNGHEIVTGDFTRQPDFHLPSEQLSLALQRKFKSGLQSFDATRLSEMVLGDSIFTNQVICGAAWQQGALPISRAAIHEAINLNGTAVQRNIRAFEIGRWAALNPEKVRDLLTGSSSEPDETLEDVINLRAKQLGEFQGPALAAKYSETLDRVSDPRLKEAVARGYHKLLAYKDEYEVARLLSSTLEKARTEFDGDLKLSYHLSPPILARTGQGGRPAKRKFGPWMGRFLPLLARFKWLRGTAFDPFGYNAERKMERALTAEYEADLDTVLSQVRPETMDAAIAWAEVPLKIRGFGPVKTEAAGVAAKRREEALAALRAGAGGGMERAAQ
jgi:indolepyruvate ferredoxin oxidoreductase